MSTIPQTCARCHQPIREGEPYDAEPVDRQSGPPVIVYRHSAGFSCKLARTPSTQSSIWR